MNLTTLKPAHPRHKTPRVGRGGKRGKTSGRGGKGQTARAGAKIRPEFRDIIKKLPKRRGYGRNRSRTVYTMRPRPIPISFADVLNAFDVGAEVNRKALLEKGLIERRGGKLPQVKIIGTGEGKKLSLVGIEVSMSARAAIEKAGGSIA